MLLFPGGISFNTTERCGGQIRVNYQNKWEKVCQDDFPPRFREALCQELGCPGIQKNRSKALVINMSGICRKSKAEKCLKVCFTFQSEIDLTAALNCSSAHNDIRHCVVPKTCKNVPAEIYCKGDIGNRADESE